MPDQARVPRAHGYFARSVPTANDSPRRSGTRRVATEQTVIEVERLLNSRAFKEHFRGRRGRQGDGFRRGDDLHVTAAVAFVDRYVDSEEQYYRRKAHLREAVMEHIGKKKDAFKQLLFEINTLDERGRGLGGCICP